MNDLLTLDETKDRLKVSKTTLYRMLAAKTLRATKVGRQWRVPVDAINEPLKKGETK
jgi:excisionase family DNA binding protein